MLKVDVGQTQTNFQKQNAAFGASIEKVGRIIYSSGDTYKKLENLVDKELKLGSFVEANNTLENIARTAQKMRNKGENEQSDTLELTLLNLMGEKFIPVVSNAQRTGNSSKQLQKLFKILKLDKVFTPERKYAVYNGGSIKLSDSPPSEFDADFIQGK